MNKKKEFGKLIVALRKERFDPIAGKNWTQTILAEKANLSPRTIGDIERGEKAVLDLATMEKLGIAFGFNEIEKRIFFSLASPAEWAFDAQEGNTQASRLPDILTILPQIETPAIIYDALFYVQGINDSFRGMVSFAPLTLNPRDLPSFQQNIIWRVFHPDSQIRKFFPEAWNQLTRFCLYHFRLNSIPFRHRPEFSQLHASLQRNSAYLDAWENAFKEDESGFPLFTYQLPDGRARQFIVAATKLKSRPFPSFFALVAPIRS